MSSRALSAIAYLIVSPGFLLRRAVEAPSRDPLPNLTRERSDNMYRLLATATSLLALIAVCATAEAKDLCLVYPSLNADKVVLSSIKSFTRSAKGKTYPIYGRIALNGSCADSTSVGMVGTAILSPDGTRFRAFLASPGIPFPCVPGSIRLDLDAASLTGNWYVQTNAGNDLSGTDLAAIDCATVPPPN